MYYWVFGIFFIKLFLPDTMPSLFAEIRSSFVRFALPCSIIHSESPKLSDVSWHAAKIMATLQLQVNGKDNKKTRDDKIFVDANVKKKFQCKPYSVTCSWYPDAFTDARRRNPNTTRGNASENALRKYFNLLAQISSLPFLDSVDTNPFAKTNDPTPRK